MVNRGSLLHLLERLAGEPHTRLRYFCSPQHTDSALYPVIGQMERAAGFRREDTAEQRLEKLETVLIALGHQRPQRSSPAVGRPAVDADRRPLSRRLNLTPQKRKEKTLQDARG